MKNKKHMGGQKSPSRQAIQPLYDNHYEKPASQTKNVSPVKQSAQKSKTRSSSNSSSSSSSNSSSSSSINSRRRRTQRRPPSALIRHRRPPAVPRPR